MSALLAELREDAGTSASAYERWFAQACAEGLTPDRLRAAHGLTTDEFFRLKTMEGAEHTYWTGPPSIRLDAGGRQKIERFVMEHHLGRTINRYSEIVTRTCSVERCIRPTHLAVGPKRRGDPAELIARLRHAARLLGRTPLRSDEGTYGVPYRTSLVHAFGSRAAAFSAAGLALPEQTGRFSERWTDEDMVVALRAHYERTGQVPRYGEWEDAHYVPSAATMRRRFGSFRLALRAAGFQA